MSYLREYFLKVQAASRILASVNASDINTVLESLAIKIESETDQLLEENRKDLDRMAEDDPKYDRLMLTPARLQSIASDLRRIAELTSPIGKIIEEKVLPNGLNLKKVQVPIGVVGIIYEARPNVTFDVFAICIKSGNACVLKGGSDAGYSNIAIVKLIHEVLDACGFNKNIIQLLPSGRDATEALINAVGYVDVIIPRGSQNLINYVRDNSRVPVIETGAGIVHTYFDKNGDKDKGKEIIYNAKTRRVSVCNALDCLIIHKDRLPDLPFLIEKLASKEVQIYADQQSFESIQKSYPKHLLEIATEGHFGIEFLDYKLSISTVEDLTEALDHIYRYSSRHSEAIISEDENTIMTFLNRVDAAVVYANASTAFTDGGQFDMGAEIGISTQKLHARGPMALEEMTSYKWIVRGNGTTRNP